MSAPTAPRRVSVERNIYRRASGVLEVGFKDGAGVQRWRTVEGVIMAARMLRDELLARRGRGEAVPANPRLRFGEAADRWLQGPVVDLRESTQSGYRNAVERHLLPRFGGRRLDALGPDDLALPVRDMRDAGKSEATIAVTLSVTGRIYKFAARRLGWQGTNPTTLMLPSERPKISLAKRRPIFTAEQIEQTIGPLQTRTARCSPSLRSPVPGSPSCAVSPGRKCGSTMWTTQSSSSDGRLIGRAIGARPRLTARLGPCRFLANSL
jgi:hypothetical protein